MKTLLLCALIIPVHFSLFSQVVTYPSGQNDPTGISPQLVRLLNKHNWGNGDATIIFSLNEMNQINLVNVQSNDKELARHLAAYLRGKEIFPRLSSKKSQYQYVLFFKPKPGIIRT